MEGYNALSFNHELDLIQKAVMPASWEGHVRLAIHDKKAEEFTGEQMNFAYNLIEKVHHKAPTKHEALANAIIKATLKETAE